MTLLLLLSLSCETDHNPVALLYIVKSVNPVTITVFTGSYELSVNHPGGWWDFRFEFDGCTYYKINVDSASVVDEDIFTGVYVEKVYSTNLPMYITGGWDTINNTKPILHQGITPVIEEDN